MKFIFDSVSQHNYDAHTKHIKEYVNDVRCSDYARKAKKALDDFKSKYDNIANTLQSLKAGKSDDITSSIVGFIQKDGNYVKYDRLNNDYLVYDPNNSISNSTITMFKVNASQYVNRRNKNFLSELPEN